jgi:hypothetical protein
MFEAHRKYKHCILCEMYGVTREHLFGKSLASKLGIKVPWAAVSKSTKPEHHNLLLKGSSPITNLAPPLLCAKCNNERLTELMKTSLPPLLLLIHGGCACISMTDGAVLLRYFERVAMIVDVATSNHQVTARHRVSSEFYRTDTNRVAAPVISQEGRTKWLRGACLPEVKVFVGNHEGVLGLNPDMCITHRRIREQEGGPVLWYAKRISIVIGKLAICIDVNIGATAVPPSFLPLGSTKITWPPDAQADYQDYLSLRDQDAEIRHLRTILHHTETREEMERLSRKAGTLTMPFVIS